MCQLNGLKNKSPKDGLPANDLLFWYRKWAQDDPFDIGGTTRTALEHQTDLSIKDHIAQVSKVNAHSKSNGSMMRMTPLCVWTRNLSIEKRVECFQLDSKLTHPNQSILDACSAYGLAVSELIKNLGDISGTLEVVENWLQEHANQEVNGWFQESSMDKLDNYKVYPQAGYVRWGFTLAFYFLRNNVPYQEAIERTLILGGDTDTNAAIVGGIVGANVGETQLPNNLVNKMLKYEKKASDPKGWKRPDYLSPRNLLHWIDELFYISA